MFLFGKYQDGRSSNGGSPPLFSQFFSREQFHVVPSHPLYSTPRPQGLLPYKTALELPAHVKVVYRFPLSKVRLYEFLSAVSDDPVLLVKTHERRTFTRLFLRFSCYFGLSFRTLFGVLVSSRKVSSYRLQKV